jgi:hypothetical protein
MSDKLQLIAWSVENLLTKDCLVYLGQRNVFSKNLQPRNDKLKLIGHRLVFFYFLSQPNKPWTMVSRFSS